MDNNVNLATPPLHLLSARTEENMLVSADFTERGRRRRTQEQGTSGTQRRVWQTEAIPPFIASDRSAAASTVPDFSPRGLLL